MDERPKPGSDEEIIGYAQEFLRQEYTHARERMLGSELNPDDFQTLQDQLSLEEARQTLAFILGESQIPILERTSPQRLIRDGSSTENLEKRYTRIQNFSLGFAKALGDANLLRDTSSNPQPLQRLESTIRNALFENGIRAAYHAEQGGYDQTMLEIMKFYANHQELPVPTAQDIRILKSFNQEYAQPNGWRILFREITGRPYIPFIYITGQDQKIPEKRDFYPAHVYIDSDTSHVTNTALIKSDTIIIGSPINGSDQRNRTKLGISANHFATTASADCEYLTCHTDNAYLEGGQLKKSKILAQHAVIEKGVQLTESQIMTITYTDHAQVPTGTVQQINEYQATREKVDFDIQFKNY